MRITGFLSELFGGASQAGKETDAQQTPAAGDTPDSPRPEQSRAPYGIPAEENQYNFGGFLLKIISPEQLRASLHTVMDGVGVFDDEAIARLRRREKARAAVEFNEREMKILHYVCQGLSDKEIADKLSLHPGTIKNLVSIMLNKTFCVSRTALARYAIENKPVRTDHE